MRMSIILKRLLMYITSMEIIIIVVQVHVNASIHLPLKQFAIALTLSQLWGIRELNLIK